MIDSHCHIALCDPDPEEVVEGAVKAGLTRMLEVGLDEESSAAAIATARRFADRGVFAAVGRHPTSTEGFDEAAATELSRLADDPRVVAIGETGLDYYRDSSPPRSDQHDSLLTHVEIARRTGKALILHLRDGEGPDRDAIGEAFELLEEPAKGLTVILHCFSGTPEQAVEASARGWYCSFAGNVTYPKSDQLRHAAAVVSEDLLLVETDAPFLTPQSMRGKPNLPENVVETAGVVADARGITYRQLDEIVEANAARAFGW